jgi:hypothetical protein
MRVLTTFVCATRTITAQWAIISGELNTFTFSSGKDRGVTALGEPTGLQIDKSKEGL